MVQFKKIGILAVAAAGFSLAGLAVKAQMPPAEPSARQAPSGEQLARAEHHSAPRQVALHAKLKLTATQEDAWKTFLEKTAPAHPDRTPAHLRQADWDRLTTPERLDRRLANMQLAMARLREHAAAVKAFYAVLSADQQQVFDAQSRKRERRRFGHGHGHGYDGAAEKKQ